jgi:hypothetical protein
MAISGELSTAAVLEILMAAVLEILMATVMRVTPALPVSLVELGPACGLPDTLPMKTSMPKATFLTVRLWSAVWRRNTR